MNTTQHRAIAEWHIKQAELHEATEDYLCDCPVAHHITKSNTEILQEMGVDYYK
jgi:hypothetical protein